MMWTKGLSEEESALGYLEYQRTMWDMKMTGVPKRDSRQHGGSRKDQTVEQDNGS